MQRLTLVIAALFSLPFVRACLAACPGDARQRSGRRDVMERQGQVIRPEAGPAAAWRREREAGRGLGHAAVSLSACHVNDKAPADMACQSRASKAGDGARTHDIHVGNLT